MNHDTRQKSSLITFDWPKLSPLWLRNALNDRRGDPLLQTPFGETYPSAGFLGSAGEETGSRGGLLEFVHGSRFAYTLPFLQFPFDDPCGQPETEGRGEPKYMYRFAELRRCVLRGRRRYLSSKSIGTGLRRI